MQEVGDVSSLLIEGAARAADQCHLEESSIVFIFVSSILHEITPNTLLQTAKNVKILSCFLYYRLFFLV